MKSGVKMLLFGVLIGIVLSLVGSSIIKEITKKVIIYEAKADMLVGGMRIPKGFKFFKVTSMPEGLDVIKVEVCVFRGYLDKLFVVRKYIKGEILDYWVNEKSIVK